MEFLRSFLRRHFAGKPVVRRQEMSAVLGHPNKMFRFPCDGGSVGQAKKKKKKRMDTWRGLGYREGWLLSKKAWGPFLEALGNYQAR